MVLTTYDYNMDFVYDPTCGINMWDRMNNITTTIVRSHMWDRTISTRLSTLKKGEVFFFFAHVVEAIEEIIGRMTSIELQELRISRGYPGIPYPVSLGYPGIRSADRISQNLNSGLITIVPVCTCWYDRTIVIIIREDPEN